MNEERIFRLPIIRYFRTRYLKNHEEFLKGNRRDVLLMYRTFLKIIPKLFTRKLVIHSKLEECKYLFHQSKNQPFIENIKHSMKVGFFVLEKIEKGEYPPFPQFDHTTLAGNEEDLDIFLKREA